LYILLCGYPPFTGGDEEAILNAVKEDELVFDDIDWADKSA